MFIFSLQGKTISLCVQELITHADYEVSHEEMEGSFPVFIKGTTEILAFVPQTSLSPENLDELLEKSGGAQRSWAKKLPQERADILNKWHRLVLEKAEDLALLLTAEQGKPLIEARAEIAYAASFLEFYAQEATRVYGTVVPSCAHEQADFVIRQPIGVCLAITPWNFPAAMVTRKVAPALAVGCSILLKPAPETPLSAMALVSLARQAGVPEGVLTLVLASEEQTLPLLNPIIEDKRVAKITFTGSTEVGKSLMNRSSLTLKRLSLELGGNAPFLVFEDADIEKAAQTAVAAKFRNMGQTCVCVNRFLVAKSIYEAFLVRIIHYTRGLRVGYGFQERISQGPMISQAALRKTEEHLEDALSKGAQLHLGGRILKECFFEPTILTHVTPAMRVFQEETFGPLAAVTTFQTEEEAIALANNTSFGLAAYCFTQDVSRCWRVSEKLEYGMVGVNTRSISSASMPFGGWKNSGLGREGGPWGLDAFLEIKHIAIGL